MMNNDPVQTLLEIEAIKQLKYCYFRHLDSKQFAELVLLFSEDATTAYDNGRHSYKGRQALKDFLDEGMGTHECFTQHQAHHPEIAFVDDTHATGVWHFEDTVYRKDLSVKISGAGIYWDEYEKTDAGWEFTHTGYERLWVCAEKIDMESYLEMRSFWDVKEVKRSNGRDKKAGELGLFPVRNV